MENNQAAKKAFARYAERQGSLPKNQAELIEHYAVKTAIENSGKDIPLHIVTISPDGKIIR